MALYIAIILFLVLSAFFSGSEIAFISANKLDVAVRKEKNVRKGRIITDFYDKPKSFLGTMLVGNNISLVAFTYFMTKLLAPTVERNCGDGVVSLLIYTLVITIIVLILGEFLPKTIFSLYATKSLFILAYPLAFFKWMLSVPTYVMTGLSNFFLRKFLGVNDVDAGYALNRVDLEHYIEDQLSDEHDDIDKEILTNALNLGDNNVAHCMIPRTEIISVDKNTTGEELIEVLKESKHSRIIVTDGDVDNIIGYVHHQQFLFDIPESIQPFIIEMPYVPEVMNLKELLTEFMQNNVSIACVVNEFGGTSGIITLEDILEEIFGDIEDEHDKEDFTSERINDDEYLFSGRLEIDQINEKYPELNIPEGDYQTLSGYIVMTAEVIPGPGDELLLGHYCFKIEDVDETKIGTVRVLRRKDIEEED